MNASPVFQLTTELMRRESVTPDDGGCLDLIGARLSAAGMACERMDSGAVGNLLASHGSGRPHLMLLGHVDVVPPGSSDDWTSPPFAPEVRDGVLYGRGAADMKASVAAFVVMLEDWLREYAGHAGRVSLLLTSDEEGPAVDGVRAVVAQLKQRDALPDYCLVGEPSSRDLLGDTVRIGRRGSIQARLAIRGRQGHTAYAEPEDNPVHRAAPVIAALTAMTFDDGDDSFPPTRLQVSNLAAGTGADNVTPGTLELCFNLRNNPNSSADELHARIDELIRRHDPGDWTLDWRVSGEPFGPADGALAGAVSGACREVLDIEPQPDTGGGTSDGRFFGPLGIPVVELGPVNRSIHRIDECIRVDDLERLPALYRHVVTTLLAAD